MCFLCCTKVLLSKHCIITPDTQTTKDSKVPKHLFDPYIVRGFRMKYHTIPACLVSLFQMHNETLNVWTALIPALYFLWKCFQVFFLYEEDLVPSYERYVMLTYSLGAFISFAASSMFHLFCCMSKNAFFFTLQLDMLGIAFLIGASYIPPIYYAFYCAPVWRTVYAVVILCLTLMASFMFVIPKFMTDKFRTFRILVFTSIAAFGITMVIHIINERGHEPHIAKQILQIFLMYGMYGAGVVFYASRFPEKYIRGVFDFYLHSHNFWHTFVFLGALVHQLNVDSMMLTGKSCVQDI